MVGTKVLMWVRVDLLGSQGLRKGMSEAGTGGQREKERERERERDNAQSMHTCRVDLQQQGTSSSCHRWDLPNLV